MKLPALLLICCLMTAATHGQGTARYDVVIDEIMADPSPQIGLPNHEWIELKNISVKPINLQGWRIEDATGQSGPMPSFILQPDSFVIICTGSAVPALGVFGKTISVTSFPSLDNDGDLLVLRSPQNQVIHAVNYSVDWYKNALKKEGGWTLEMIDPHQPCLGMENWMASTHASGGTPGKRNAVDAALKDDTAPVLLRSFTLDSLTVVAVFSEPLDSFSASVVPNYQLNNGMTIQSVYAMPPLFQQVMIRLAQPMQKSIIYQVTASNIYDCRGNQLAGLQTVKTGLAEQATTGDAIINEILFNPRSNAYDYIEVLNNSNKILDASKMYLANRNSNNAINSIKQIKSTTHYLFPGEYFVVTVDLASLQVNYLVKDPTSIFSMPVMPAYPDDHGFVVLLNEQGNLVDEVDYYKSWHFKLIDNDEGVALERIDPGAASNLPANWHSAASTAGYGTPGYKNSQYKTFDGANGLITVTPKVFSPDNDGRDDIATIMYQLPEPGYVIQVTIFDAAGRKVKTIAGNAIAGIQGSWNWDGLDDLQKPLPIGQYIIATEIFNLQGKKQTDKKVIVLARPLK